MSTIEPTRPAATVRPAPAGKPAAPPKAAGKPRCDELTLGAGAAAATPADPPVGQAWHVERGALHLSHTVRIDADPERVLAALEGDWATWWPKSAAGAVPSGLDLPAAVEHERRFEFRPEGEPARVVRQFAPEAEAIGKGAFMMVVPLALSGSLQGAARYEVRVTPDGKTLLTSRWNGVTPAAGSPEQAAKRHLAAEEAGFAGLAAWIARTP